MPSDGDGESPSVDSGLAGPGPFVLLAYKKSFSPQSSCSLLEISRDTKTSDCFLTAS
jgi:hypothetical protein